MSLFCREIMLYNEFVPALEPEKHNWEYRAYGHYDGIGIGKKIEFQNGSSFEKIYTSCAESDSENMSYATQTLLGFFEKFSTFIATREPAKAGSIGCIFLT